uniref:Uncharacterized protein n=1 Tax=Romanomermis culicivorax TaxID=13658 RepID=A0A915ITN9_ROMCU
MKTIILITCIALIALIASSNALVRAVDHIAGAGENVAERQTNKRKQNAENIENRNTNRANRISGRELGQSQDAADNQQRHASGILNAATN